MSLATIPLVFVLAGLALYIILAGADFGAAVWEISAPPTDAGRRLRDFAHNVMAPVWEANHVWLIFVLTVTWTAYPAAFGSIASTLSVPLLLAVLGIVARGAAYAVSAGTSGPRGTRDVDRVAALSSVLAPFALGTCLGAIASERVPYGNARGDLLTSWVNPTSLLTGALAVAISAHLAAVYLCDDARRRGAEDLVAPYRRRALTGGVVAGALAVGGLLVLRADARALYDGLTEGGGLAAVVVSAAAGVAALGLVARERFGAARYTAAVAVAAIVAGWALAQQPRLLPGLTVEQAAAPRDTLVAVVVAVVGGGLVLGPSLLVLFRLSLGGRLGYDAADDDPTTTPSPQALVLSRAPAPRAVHVALAGLGGGVAFLTIAEAGWAHAIGVVCLLGAAVAGVVAAAPALLADP